jgi:nitrite reductase/ring-hydroxylating ferredoxin subunit
MTSSDINSEGEDCSSCPLTTRRDFLRGLSGIAVAAISLALPIRTVKAAVLSSGLTGKSLSYPVPNTDGVDIDRDNDVILVRYNNEVMAFALSCPHQNTALRWNDENNRFQCPKHHSQYTPEGVFITGRATRNMDRLAIRRDSSNNIIVDPDTVYQSDDNPKEWADAVIKV